MIFVSCENSSSLATRQPQTFSSSQLSINKPSTSIFFNCERMTILLFKYHCALREYGTIVSRYGKFSEDLLEEIFDAIGNQPAVFPFRFIFIFVNNSRDIKAQLFALRNFIILIKRKKKLSNTLHIAPDGEFIFSEIIIRKTLKQSRYGRTYCAYINLTIKRQS